MSIGMATYKDFNGVYFTVMALQLYQDLTDCEIIIVDNYGCDNTKDFCGWVSNCRYIRNLEVTGTSRSRNEVFRQAQGEVVLCMDCHVMLVPDAIAKLKQFYRDHPNCYDLLSGALLYDDCRNCASSFTPTWSCEMYGQWHYDEEEKQGEPFEIPMMGLGLFSSRRLSWLGFNDKCRAFGGEEGYIHQKYRAAGRRCLCLPWLKWVHRFGRPEGVPYELRLDRKIQNYFIGWIELGLDVQPIRDHFRNYASEEFLNEQETYARNVLSGVWEPH